MAAESRIEKGGREPKVKDVVCRVRVYPTGTDSATKKLLNDNITETLFIKGGKVSDVSKQIQKAFGG